MAPEEKEKEKLEEMMNSLSKEQKEQLDEHAHMLFKKLPLRIKMKIFFAMALSNPSYRKYFLWLDVVILLALVYWITGVITQYFIEL
jgi:hypothetical protein